jgi:translation machinery-associated protein 16
MPKSFAKVHKHVSKKKGAKPTALNANSRDSRSLIRAGIRDDRVHKTEALRQKLNLPYLIRIQFVQDSLFGEDEEARETMEARAYAVEEVQDLIETFLERNSEEYEAVKAARRPGRPAAAREEALKTLEAQEKHEYEVGFWVPDLGDADNVKAFKEWKGKWIGLNIIKFVRVAKDGQVKPSAWPPKGNS